MSKKLILGIVGALVIGGVVFAIAQRNIDDSTRGPNETNFLQGDGSDPTDEANDEKQKAPGSADDNSSSQSSGSSRKSDVSVTLTALFTDENLVHARGYANTMQSGTCTLVLEQPGKPTKTYEEETQFETSYVSCNPFEIPKSDFESGTWQGKILFESKDHKGTSNASEVQI